MARDPYDVLGVPKKASEAEIKKAFRSLAKKHHPDTHGNDPGAVKKFQEVNAAYEIVGDKEKRAQYDRGEIDAAGQPRGFDPGAQGYGGFRPGPGRGAGPGPGGFRWSTSEEAFDADDILSDLFGGLGGGRRGKQPRKGEDLQFSTTVTLEEAAHGTTRRVVLGDGRQVEARIPSGVKDGQVIRLRGQGGAGHGGGPPGDALISVNIAPHPRIQREGRDLKMDLPITLKEAVLGGKVTVPTLSGSITLTVPANSNTGKTLRLKNKGLPGAGGEPAGDLYVRLVVTLPDTPDPKLEAFAKGWNADYDPRARLK